MTRLSKPWLLGLYWAVGVVSSFEPEPDPGGTTTVEGEPVPAPAPASVTSDAGSTSTNTTSTTIFTSTTSTSTTSASTLWIGSAHTVHFSVELTASQLKNIGDEWALIYKLTQGMLVAAGSRANVSNVINSVKVRCEYGGFFEIVAADIILAISQMCDVPTSWVLVNGQNYSQARRLQALRTASTLIVVPNAGDVDVVRKSDALIGYHGATALKNALVGVDQSRYSGISPTILNSPSATISAIAHITGADNSTLEVTAVGASVAASVGGAVSVQGINDLLFTTTALTTTGETTSLNADAVVYESTGTNNAVALPMITMWAIVYISALSWDAPFFHPPSLYVACNL